MHCSDGPFSTHSDRAAVSINQMLSLAKTLRHKQATSFCTFYRPKEWQSDVNTLRERTQSTLDQ